ncbi:DedA family protein [Teredinibacter sp. KSP-S5-2]|uniref:DedA family protein n=1 Tax=Teredinibacter sp. KSP-S5-2 TaxID=3034506 RepID=UPI0029348CAB|nr:VTT domain-containing protein [Teredinibacter sp. KSP-S5-2]WNO10107.1 VTT domain-containing protein [Teredinibacter sp. KSP-S5-2]
MIEFLQQYASSPVLLAMALIVVSWIWEDASVVSGALFAADELISVPVAAFSVFVGIASGDLALYYLGRLAQRWRGLRFRLLKNPYCRVLNRRFRARLLSNIFIIRFIPGLRTLGFTLCGLWRVPQIQFITAMGVAGILWVAIVFSGVYSLGVSRLFVDSSWKYSLLAVALLLLLVNNYFASRKFTTK